MQKWKKNGFFFILLCMFSYGCGRTEKPNIVDSNGSCKIKTLYTDGIQVYGLYTSRLTGFSNIVRFCMEHIETDHKQRVIEVEYLVPKGE